MKFNRFLSMLLILVLMLSASAMAELAWDFTGGNFGTGTVIDDGYEETDTYSYVSNDYVLISGGDVHVRDYPSLNGGKLGVLYKGSTASCLGGQSVDDRGVVWYEINFKGRSGWVSSKYAKLNGQSGEAAYVSIVDGQCHLRLTPDLNGEVLAILEEGSRCVYQGRTSTDYRGVDWYQVSYNGQAGWVSSVYAKLGVNNAAPVTSSGSYVKATSHKVNLRDEPSLNGKDIETMDKGQTATYLGKKSTDSRGVIWYKVRFAGKTGWVSSRYTKLYN